MEGNLKKAYGSKKGVDARKLTAVEMGCSAREAGSRGLTQDAGEHFIVSQSSSPFSGRSCLLIVNWVQDVCVPFLFSLQSCVDCPCLFPFLSTWFGQIFPYYQIEKMIIELLLVFPPV